VECWNVWYQAIEEVSGRRGRANVPGGGAVSSFDQGETWIRRGCGRLVAPVRARHAKVDDYAVLVAARNRLRLCAASFIRRRRSGR